MGYPSCTVLEINSYIGNLTSSYTEKSNEPSMVAASVIMFVLTGLFFQLNLFSGISDISAILDPKVRLFLTSALSLFLPVMSYLFSEAKNTGFPKGSTTGSTQVPDLPLRAGLILAWMLLVELIRKKVDEIRMRGFSGTIQRAGRVVWLGSLVFFNIHRPGRKAVFSILWILCATKVLQRIAFTEVGKRSYAHGKNARLISSYMSQMLERELPQDAHQLEDGNNEMLIKACKYIVMGEEKLVDIEPTADGYKLGRTKSPDYDSMVKLLEENDSIITVGKVWELDDKDKFFSLQQIQSLKRICVSFALFKLLRRRFEHLPAVTKEEARSSQNLILKGLYSKGQASSSGEAVFQVLNDEVNFLSEYYHSVVPVVLANPFFLFINYFLVNIVVAVLCFMTVILCGNGDVRYALHSLGADNYTLQNGVGNIAICLLLKATNSPSAFFSIVDLSITVLLFIIFFYEEIWEFFVFLLSNWFMVSLVYNYIAKPSWLKRSTFRGALYWGGFSIILWLRSKMSHADLRMKQFSVLNLRWPPKLPLFSTFTSMAVKTVVVPNSVKESIMKYLDKQHDDPQANPLTNGMSTLHNCNNLSQDLSWACKSNSVTEVILTWHIATSIMEVKCDTPQSDEDIGRRKVAFRLSKYCAYLVAFHPELLPDNPEKVEYVFADMKAELKAILGCQDYYLSSQHKRVNKIMDKKTTSKSDDQIKVVQYGVNLARSLMGEANRWQVLADVWTDIIIYLAPSSDEEHVKGHEEVLVQGGEFITVLWALTTHIGISRPSKSEINVGYSAA